MSKAEELARKFWDDDTSIRTPSMAIALAVNEALELAAQEAEKPMWSIDDYATKLVLQLAAARVRALKSETSKQLATRPEQSSHHQEMK
jgi:hypothetical protein